MRPPVQLQVIATTKIGTRAALTKARQLARRLNVARTVVLVPRIGSWVSAGATSNDTDTVKCYREMAGQTGVDATIRLCLTASAREVSRWMLPRGSMIVVGGRRRWWWPTRAQRIAEQLKRAGHVVVFADESEADCVST